MAEFASKGLGATAASLGGAALGLSVLNGGLGNLLGGGWGGNGCCSENQPVNRYELTMTQQLANKDMEISDWRGQDETNRKISDAYANLEGQIQALSREVRCNKEEQGGINLQQAVYNGTNTAAIGCLQSQVAQLFGITKLVVPNTSVCPGWGNVTITPAAATTT